MGFDSSEEFHRFLLAALVGFVAALFCAALWGIVAGITGYKIGLLALGFGYIIGYSMLAIGQGRSILYGIMGSGFAFFAIVFGNLFSFAVVLANNVELVEQFGATTTLGAFGMLLSCPGALMIIMQSTLHPMELLFYGIALYTGFTSSFHRESE